MARKRVDIIASIGAQDQTAAAFNSVQGNVDKLSSSVGRSANTVNNNFRMMRGGVAQFGFQIQDIAVQLQGGQSPLLILGQQGSQIASLFGAGGAISGAIIAVGAALGTALMPQLMGTEKALADVDQQLSLVRQNMRLTADGTGILTDELEQQAKVSKELATTALLQSYNAALVAVAQSTRDLADETEVFEKSRAVFKLGAGYIHPLTKEFGLSRQAAHDLNDAVNMIGSGNTVEGVALLKDKLVELIDPQSRVNDEFRIAAGEVLGVIGQYEEASASADQLKRILEGLAAGSDVATESTERSAKAISEQLEALRMEADLLGKTERAQALYAAAKNNATPEQLAEINLIYDRIEAFDQEQEALKEHQRFVEQLTREYEANRQRQVDADLRAYDEATSILTREQESLLKGTDAINAEYDKRIDAVRNALATIGAEKARYAELETALEQERADALVKYQQDALQKELALYQARFQAAGQLSGALAGIFREGTKEQRAFLAIQKGLAVGEAVMNMHRAISNANALPWPANMMAIAQATTTGLGAVAGIRAVSFEGGGFTGNGARVGGLDGKGGMPAIVHPNETIIDHEKGGGLGTNVNITIMANDTKDFDRLLQSRRGQIISIVRQGLNDQGRRL